MTNEELKEQFERCKEWQDPKQWDLLGMAYDARGFAMNALYCFRQAEALRTEAEINAAMDELDQEPTFDQAAWDVVLGRMAGNPVKVASAVLRMGEARRRALSVAVVIPAARQYFDVSVAVETEEVIA